MGSDEPKMGDKFKSNLRSAILKAVESQFASFLQGAKAARIISGSFGSFFLKTLLPVSSIIPK
jgi:hypothetical protein